MKKTLLACLFGLGLGACVNAADVQEINIAYVKAPFNLQNIVMKHNQMMEKEFAKDGIKVKWHDITSGAKQTQAMAAGSLDASAAMNTASILMAKDKLFFPNEKYTLPLYANQWIPLAVKTTIKEKIRISSILDKACNGGSIAHINISTPFKSFEEAWDILNLVASSGCNYFAFCYRISVCKTNHSFFGETCPYCGEPKYTTVQRIVGFLVPEKNYSKERKEEYWMRYFF